VRTAWIYSRVSSDEQEKGTSLHYQPDECRRFAQREGLVVVNESQDVLSGLRVDRPGYQKMLAGARKKEMDLVLVWRYDRLGRRESEWHRCLEELEGLGIEVWSATEPCDALYKSIAAGLAADEVRRLSKRVLTGKQARFRDGYWHGSAPFGYVALPSNRQGSVLEPDVLNEDGRAVMGSPAWLVQQMFARYASGESIGRLREFLAEHGVKKSKYGIRYVLESTAYVGKVRTGMYSRPHVVRPKTPFDEVDGRHVPLVDPETFERCRVRLEANERLLHRGPEGKYLFRGLIYCGTCQRRYVGRRNGRGGRHAEYYACNRRLNLNDCESHSIASSRLEEAVLEPLGVLLLSVGEEDLKQRVRQLLRERLSQVHAEDQSARESMARLKAHLERDLERWTEKYVADDIPRDHYLRRRKEIEEELSEIGEKLAQASPSDPSELMELIEPLTASVDLRGSLCPPDGAIRVVPGWGIGPTVWRALLEALVERIDILDREIEVTWREGVSELCAVIAQALAEQGVMEEALDRFIVEDHDEPPVVLSLEMAPSEEEWGTHFRSLDKESPPVKASPRRRRET
jgi:site-specific DNA recombinase